MQQDSQLSCRGDDGSLLPVFSTPLGQFQPPAAQIAVGAEWSQDVLRPLHQQRSQVRVALLADVHLRLALSGVPSPWLQSQIAAHISTPAEAMRGLVNARHTKNLPGRKSDVQESQWLLKLHTYGLLNNSFQPPAEIRALRTYWRQRGEHVGGAATCIQRIQKALTQMNLQLANVISDISGLTGQAIIRAIVAGERDPQKLAEFRDPRIQATHEEIAKSLEGTWRPELLFVLQQQLEMYDTYQRRIAECDQQLQRQLASMADSTASQSPQPAEKKHGKRAKPAKNAPRFDLSRELQRITGVDLTRIDGIDVMIAQTLLSEVGADMSRWKTEAHFASWLGLCPDNRVSGDKVLRRGTRHVVNRAANALRQAANALIRSRSYLGAQYRRLRTKLGAPKAITAMAHRLARLVYRMLKYGQRYVDKGTEYYEQRYRNQQLQMLRKNAAKLGLQIMEAPA